MATSAQVKSYAQRNNVSKTEARKILDSASGVTSNKVITLHFSGETDYVQYDYFTSIKPMLINKLQSMGAAQSTIDEYNNMNMNDLVVTIGEQLDKDNWTNPTDLQQGFLHLAIVNYVEQTTWIGAVIKDPNLNVGSCMVYKTIYGGYCIRFTGGYSVKDRYDQEDVYINFIRSKGNTVMQLGYHKVLANINPNSHHKEVVVF